MSISNPDRKMQLELGMVRQLRNDGLSTSEIATKMGLTESHVRALSAICNIADKNRKQPE